MGGNIGHANLGCFDHQMLERLVVGAHRFKIEALEDAEADQRRQSLAIRRDLVHAVAAEIDADWRHPVGRVRREVVERQGAAVFRGGRRDRFGKLAAIEGFAVRFSDRLQRRRMRPAAEEFARLWRAAIGQEGFGETGIAAQPLDLVVPLARDARAHHEAVAGIADRSFEQRLERQLAEFLVQRDPGGDRAGNGHRVPARHRHAVAAGETLRRPPGRRAAGSVEAVQLIAVPDDREGIAADSVHGRLDDRQRDRRGDGRIDRIAAARQHREARLSGQRLRRCHDIGGKHRHAVRCIGKRPVHLAASQLG